MVCKAAATHTSVCYQHTCVKTAGWTTAKLPEPFFMKLDSTPAMIQSLTLQKSVRVAHAGSRHADARAPIAALPQPMQHRIDDALRCNAHRARMPVPRVAKTSMETISVGPVQELVPPYRVLITGSTKGVGRALAEQFVRAGDSVVITSRDGTLKGCFVSLCVCVQHNRNHPDERVAATVRELQAIADSLSNGARVVGLACNVAKASDVAALADYAVEQLGGVDMWCVDW